MPLKFNPLLKIGLDEVNPTGAGASATVDIGSAIGSGTAGSVLFIDASGNLAQDNGQLFWDDTNNRLGIGTNGPGSNLEVSGASGQVAIFKSSSASDGAYVTFMESSTVRGYYGAGQGLLTNALANSQAARSQGAFHIATGGDNVRFTVDSASGLVGIGTTGPSELLHLASTGAARIKIAADTDNATESDVAEILMSQDGVVSTGNIGLNGDNNLVIGANSTTSPNIYFATNSTGTTYASSAEAKMTILNAGNVGIGATNPGGLLELYGAATTKTYDKWLRLISSEGGGLVIGPGDATANPVWNIETNSGEQIAFRISTSEKVRIDSTGNVGIGTTAPDKQLEINSSTGACLRLTYNDSNGSAANYSDFSVSSGGDLTIAPSGGDLSVTGTLAASTYFLRSVGNALTSAGTTRGDALQLAKEINNVTTAAAGTGVILPVGVVGMRIVLFNAGANAIQVYASASETIDGTAGSTGVPLTNAKRCEFFFVATNTWISAQLGVVSS